MKTLASVVKSFFSLTEKKPFHSVVIIALVVIVCIVIYAAQFAQANHSGFYPFVIILGASLFVVWFAILIAAIRQ